MAKTKFIANYNYNPYLAPMVKRLKEWDEYVDSHIAESKSTLREMCEKSWVLDVYNSCAIENNPLTERNVHNILHINADMYEESVTSAHTIEVWNLGQAIKTWYSWAIENPLLFDETTLKKLWWDIMESLPPAQLGSPGGGYRKGNVVVGDYSPPRWQDVPEQMEGFFLFLENISRTFSSRTFSQLKNESPIVIASAVHVWFEKIHPFIDGNGRTGRVLMNMVLLGCGYPPCIIKVKDRALYYHALKSVDYINDITPFIMLVLDSLDDWRPR